MEYYLSINGTEFNTSELEVKGTYRKENVQTNLAGGLLVDRIGNEKVEITAKLNLITDEQMTALRAARALISCPVIFDRGNTRITKTMRVLDFAEPSPKYFYSDKSQGMRYGSMTVEMEEM